MEFFSKAFDWIAQLSQKLPQIDFKTFFIVDLAVIAGTALIVALTLLGSNCRKIRNASIRVSKYLEDKDTIDDDNVGDFTTHCFSSKAPQSMRDAWVQFLGIRFGYPSEIVSEQNVFDKEVKRHRDVRANVFICIALVLVAAFAFWGYGTLQSKEMGVIHCLGLLLSAILYLVLVLLERKQYKRALAAFNTMQEDIDAKVNLQVERNYAVDSSPITQISTILDEIIARNTSKYIETEEPAPETTEEEPAAEEPAEQSEEIAEETSEETQEEQQPEEPEEEPETVEEEELEELEELEEEVLVEEEEAEELAEEEETEEQPEEETEQPAEEQEEAQEEEQAEEEPEQQEEQEEQPEEEGEESSDEQPAEEEEAPAEEEEPSEEAQEPEEDEEEEPAPSKLVKLPSLIDYMLSMNLPRAVKINFAMKLLGQYNKRKDDPEDKAIIIECLKKIIADLTKQQQA